MSAVAAAGLMSRKDSSTIKAHYRNLDVLARITEFLGGGSVAEASCLSLGRCDTSCLHVTHSSPNEVQLYLEQGVDIGRSLWDRHSLIADLDVEYVNFDFRGEPYLNQERAFAIQQPVESAIKRVLSDYGIESLHLLTGRGHHFIWRIRRVSAVFKQLAQLGRVPESLLRLNAMPHPPSGEVVDPDLGAAFAGLGLVMEHVAHRVKQEAAPLCRVPVQLTEVVAGPRERGREIVSIDLSEYGDPLHTRTIRVPFTVYLKPWECASVFRPEEIEKIPLIFVIPLRDLNTQEGLSVRSNVARVASLAKTASVQIPDQSEPMAGLMAAYAESSLAKAHNWFYSQEHEPVESWPQTYDRTPLDILPPCVRTILEQPNDLLLKPAGIEQVVRAMLALGWHPRHIAGLIRSKYERDYGWGEQWMRYNPATRADFYTRLFTSFMVTGQDELVDFNCQSTQEKQFCFNSGSYCSLEQFRKSFLQRREHERLACGPFNRLFLSNEHFGQS